MCCKKVVGWPLQAATVPQPTEVSENEKVENDDEGHEDKNCATDDSFVY